MSQRIIFYTTLVQREKLDEWSVRETEKHIGSFVLAIPTVPLVNISRGFVVCKQCLIPPKKLYLTNLGTTQNETKTYVSTFL
jgi:hypothetical protein